MPTDTRTQKTWNHCILTVHILLPSPSLPLSLSFSFPLSLPLSSVSLSLSNISFRILPVNLFFKSVVFKQLCPSPAVRTAVVKLPCKRGAHRERTRDTIVYFPECTSHA